MYEWCGRCRLFDPGSTPFDKKNQEPLKNGTNLEDSHGKRGKENMTNDDIKTRYTGKVDPKKALEDLGTRGIEENIVGMLVAMVHFYFIYFS